MLPYATDLRPTRRPLVTWALLLTTVVLSVSLMAADRLAGPGRTAAALDSIGIVPSRFHPLTVFTYLFFHADPAHLLINLFYLYVFGGGVEEAVGRSRYILLYLAAGAVGGLLQWLVTITLLPPHVGAIPIVGASAACAGLMGLFAARYYRARLALVGLPFKPQVVAVVGVFLLLEICLGLSALLVGSAADGVAHWAHVGGFVFGLGCAQLMNLTDVASSAYLRSDAAAMEETSPGAALKKWQILLSRDPNNAAAHEGMGRAWLALGDLESAARCFMRALTLMLAQEDRSSAARILTELHQIGLPTGNERTTGEKDGRLTLAGVLIQLTPLQMFTIGGALEANAQWDLATEAFRVVSMRAPQSAEGETAVLRCATILLKRLGRPRDARVLLDLFLDRYTHSPHRGLAEQLRREAALPDANTP